MPLKIKRKPKRCSWPKGHPWKIFNPGLFKSKNEAIKGYDHECFTETLKKKVKKDGRGQMTRACK